MKLFSLRSFAILAFALITTGLTAQDFVGTWKGKLDITATQSLELLFHVKKDGDKYTTTMDSPRQGGYGISAEETLVNKDSIRIKLSTIMATYEGKKVAEDEIEGTFRQMGMAFPLRLKFTTEGNGLKRPQEPKAPFPYRTEEVSVFNAKDSIRLAGTLTLPAEGKNFTAVVLITGSGPQNRDEELMGHKPFLVLADYLTRQGFAVLRCDDRGVGKSEGNFDTATNAHFADDALACVDFLKKHPDINSKKIGVMGHSSGGSIVFRIAAERKDIPFIVSLAGATESFGDILIKQNKYSMSKSGFSQTVKDKTLELLGKSLEIAKDKSKTPEVVQKEVNEALTAFAPELSEEPAMFEGMKQVFNRYSNPWILEYLRHDTKQDIARTQCPVLAINGEKDTQVEAVANLDIIRNTLPAKTLKHSVVKSYPGLNHLFQTCTTGDFSEYAMIEETISPQVLEEIVAWLKQR